MQKRCSRCEGSWVTSFGVINDRIGNGVCSFCHGKGKAREECRACKSTGLCRACGGQGRVDDRPRGGRPRPFSLDGRRFL
jgi:hypothetical protein